MDEDVTDEQRLALDAAARFIEKACPLTRLRELARDDDSIEDEYRQQAAELGWYSLLVPEEHGGGALSDNGMVDAALVAYVRGRALQPDSFIGTNVVAYAIATAGSEAQRTTVLPELIAGRASAAWVINRDAGAVELDGAVSARIVGDEYSLTGCATFVQEVGDGGWLLVTASSDDGPTQFLLRTDTSGVTVKALDGLDITRRYAEVSLDDVRLAASAVVGAPGEAAALVGRQLAIACVLTAAESVGAMDADLSMTVAYAKDRIAFGRPIGSFQAIKHLLADTSLLLEMGKAVVASAARNVGQGEYGEESASIAKALVGDCGIDLAQNCFQVFGGIGYTWEHDQHLFLRRLTADAAIYGDPVWHRERLCLISGLDGESE
jgi:alkylation response protein AidB-like acyl-CoA dehydrogenase